LPATGALETWASGVLDAREMRQGDKGNIFVSTLFVGNKVYAIPEKAKDGKREPKVIIDKTEQATGIEFNKGTLFFATNKKIVRYDNVEDKLDNIGEVKVLTDKLPGGSDHSRKFLRIHDNNLYYPIGAPCNICDPGEYAKIYRVNLDGSGVETIASGVRNTVGFDFDPKPGKQHFGYPYCHQGNMPDPEFGWGKSCDDYQKPAALLGPHAGSLGLKFYTGKMFPAKYQGAMFIARHGPWNRTKKYADVMVAWPDGKGGAKVEPFMTGFVENNDYLGRPVDLLVMKDGSLLVSDDHAGAIYRISYGK
jgi:glucose/arabinose dehydrogenase